MTDEDDAFMRRAYQKSSRCTTCAHMCSCSTMSKKQQQEERKEIEMQDNFSALLNAKMIQDLQSERTLHPKLRGKIDRFKYQTRDESKIYIDITRQGTELQQQENAFRQSLLTDFTAKPITRPVNPTMPAPAPIRGTQGIRRQEFTPHMKYNIPNGMILKRPAR